jgi:tRNA (uracil-5-)-methyltransferase TRM9
MNSEAADRQGEFQAPTTAAYDSGPQGADSTTFAPNLASSYDVYYDSGLYGRRYPRPNLNTARLLSRIVRHDDLVLDFGCGDGRYVGTAASLGATVIGYDISASALRELSARYSAKVTNGTLRPAGGSLDDLTQMVGIEKLDAALILFGVLGHIRGDTARLQTLNGIRALMRPGAKLLATVPNVRRRFLAEQAACADLVAKGKLEPGDILYQRHTEAGPIDMYYHLFTADSFADLLRRAGFSIEWLGAESVLSERGVLTLPLGAALDRTLMAVTPLRVAYGFAAIATAGAAT